MYNILQYQFTTSVINFNVDIPIDYRVLGISNYFDTGANTNTFSPTFNPQVQIAVNYESIGLVNLSFFSVRGALGTLDQVSSNATYVGQYSITDDGIYNLWYIEESLDTNILDTEDSPILWLSANGSLNRDESGYVSQWSDSSTTSINFYNDTETTSKEFLYVEDSINSLPALYASTGSTYIQSYFTDDFDDLSSGLSMFFVLKPDPFNFGNCLLNFGASGDTLEDSFSLTLNSNFDNTTTLRFSTYQVLTETYLEASVLWDTGYQLLEVTHNGVDTANFYINGNLVASGAIGPITACSRLYNYIGKSIIGTTDSFYGNIAEILIYNTEVDEETRQSVEAYCNNKYDLGSIKPQIVPPGINIEPSDSVTVTLIAPAGTPIYWTDDGSDPTAASTLYTEPFTVSKNSFIKAKSIGLFGPSDVEKALIVVGSGEA